MSKLSAAEKLDLAFDDVIQKATDAHDVDAMAIVDDLIVLIARKTALLLGATEFEDTRTKFVHRNELRIRSELQSLLRDGLAPEEETALDQILMGAN